MNIWLYNNKFLIIKAKYYVVEPYYMDDSIHDIWVLLISLLTLEISFKVKYDFLISMSVISISIIN